MISNTGPGVTLDILRTPEARSVLWNRYFLPYEDVLDLKGVDGISSAECPDTGMLAKLVFPDRFLARSCVDIRATLHEMGHFVTMPIERCAQPAFGFKSGVPDFCFQPWTRIPTSANSLVSEAKAIAWEMVLANEIFDGSVTIEEAASALKYASDFYLYPGDNDKARLQAAAQAIRAYSASLGGLSQFDQLWTERCRALPDLIARQNDRSAALQREGEVIESIPGFHDGWDMRITRHVKNGTEAYLVQFDSELDGESTSEDFDTLAAARKWLRSVRRAYGLGEMASVPGCA